MYVDISTDNRVTWQTLYTHSNLTNTLNWYRNTINLSEYASQIVYIRFRGYSNAGTGMRDLGLDDIVVEDIPTMPILSYIPTNINFGEVRYGVQSGPKNVVISNYGVGTLTLTAENIMLSGINASEFLFSTDNLPASLDPEESVTIPVFVNPTTEGPISAILCITYNSVTYEVSLNATVRPQGLIYIGDGTVDLSLPIEPYYGFSYSQSLYLQSELNITNSVIKRISYYWNGAAEANLSNIWTIYMGHTDKIEFATTNDWVPTSNLAQVFSGEVTLPATEGWIEIILDSPFFYNNIENLVIAIDENEEGHNTNLEYFYCTQSSDYRSLCFSDNFNNPNPAEPPAGIKKQGYPNIKLKFDELPHLPPVVNLIYPPDGAIELPIEGFDLVWGLSIEGGMANYYEVYLASHEEDIYTEYCWETFNTHFNPVTEGGINFNYNQRWYWTVVGYSYQYGQSVLQSPRVFEIKRDPRVNLPYNQEFGTELSWPLDWSQTFSGGINSNRWTVSNTNLAGGTPCEMIAEWTEGTGISRLITPPVNTEGITSINVQFRTFFDNLSEGITAKLQYSYDLIIWYDTPWFIQSGAGNVTGLITTMISNLNAPITYIAWTLEGDHYTFNYWYIDDVILESSGLFLNPPQIMISNNGTISWEPVNGAIRYSIYKATYILKTTYKVARMPIRKRILFVII